MNWALRAIILAVAIQLFVVAMVYTEPLINRIRAWRFRRQYRGCPAQPARYVRKPRPAQVLKRSR